MPRTFYQGGTAITLAGSQRRSSARGLGWRIDVEGLDRLLQAFDILSDSELKMMRPALEKAGNLAVREIRASGGSVAGTATFNGPVGGIKGRGKNMRAMVAIPHPGAKSMEFGRNFYWAGYSGRDVAGSGIKFYHDPGQAARPFLGVMGEDHAIGRMKPKVEAILRDMINDVWESAAGKVSAL